MQNSGGVSRLYLFWSSITTDFLYKQRWHAKHIKNDSSLKLFKFWNFFLAWWFFYDSSYTFVFSFYHFVHFSVFPDNKNAFPYIPFPLTYFQKKLLCILVFHIDRKILWKALYPREVPYPLERMVSLQPTNVLINVHNSILYIISFNI